MSLNQVLGVAHLGPTSAVVVSQRAVASGVLFAVSDGHRLSLLTRGDGPIRLWVRACEEPGLGEVVLQTAFNEAPIVFANGALSDVSKQYDALSRQIMRSVRAGRFSFRGHFSFLSGVLWGVVLGVAVISALYVFAARMDLAAVTNRGELSRVSSSPEHQNLAPVVTSAPPNGGSSGRSAGQAGASAPLGSQDAIVAAALEIREAILTGRSVSEEQISRLPPDVQRVARNALALRDAGAARGGRPSVGGAGDISQPLPLFEGATLHGAPVPLDRFGVPTLPAEGSQARRAERPRLPLPGGGDIQVPDDLRNFGLSPH